MKQIGQSRNWHQDDIPMCSLLQVQEPPPQLHPLQTPVWCASPEWCLHCYSDTIIPTIPAETFLPTSLFSKTNLSSPSSAIWAALASTSLQSQAAAAIQLEHLSGYRLITQPTVMVCLLPDLSSPSAICAFPHCSFPNFLHLTLLMHVRILQ